MVKLAKIRAYFSAKLYSQSLQNYWEYPKANKCRIFQAKSVRFIHWFWV